MAIVNVVSVGGSTGEIRRMRAVIIVPAGPPEDVDEWIKECLAYCEADGLLVAHTLVGRGWRAAVELVINREAEVIVVARRSHLSPARVPQLRVVDEENEKKVARRRGLRRPRIINR